VLDPKTSKRIFDLAKVQQDELELPDDDEESPQSPQKFSRPRLQIEDDDDDEDLSVGEEPGDVEAEFVRLSPPKSRIISSNCAHVANRFWRYENIRCIASPQCW
jgi:hypothetical protein